VGVDVPNATVMAIQHAERYGLSQLHQLRGRVGRGGKQAWCLLFTESISEQVWMRLDVLCRTRDGFRIAEEDLRLRGPGELLGTRQHGIPELKVADLTTDIELLLAARDDAIEIVSDDPQLMQAEHQPLRAQLLRHHGESLELARVG